MNKIVITVCMLTLLVLTNHRMFSFDSIIKCAGSAKKLVANYNKIRNNLANPSQVIKKAASTLKEIPEMLAGCGKERQSSLYSKYLSRRCLDLLQLQAKFTLKTISYRIQFGQAHPLVKIYSKLKGKVQQHKNRHCEILQINISQMVDVVKHYRCYQKGEKLIQMIKGTKVQLNSAFENLQSLYQMGVEASLTCVEELNEIFPMMCLAEIIKMRNLILKMDEYETAAKWIWENVSAVRLGIQSTTKECSKFLKLF